MGKTADSHPKRCVIRANMSGVWANVEILGDGALPDMITIRGRRAHQWSGPVDCSGLAQLGPDPSGSLFTCETVVDLQLSDIYEVHHMSQAAVNIVSQLPVYVEPNEKETAIEMENQ